MTTRNPNRSLGVSRRQVSNGDSIFKHDGQYRLTLVSPICPVLLILPTLPIVSVLLLRKYPVPKIVLPNVRARVVLKYEISNLEFAFSLFQRAR